MAIAAVVNLLMLVMPTYALQTRLNGRTSWIEVERYWGFQPAGGLFGTLGFTAFVLGMLWLTTTQSRRIAQLGWVVGVLVIYGLLIFIGYAIAVGTTEGLFTGATGLRVGEVETERKVLVGVAKGFSDLVTGVVVVAWLVSIPLFLIDRLRNGRTYAESADTTSRNGVRASRWWRVATLAVTALLALFFLIYASDSVVNGWNRFFSALVIPFLILGFIGVLRTSGLRTILYLVPVIGFPISFAIEDDQTLWSGLSIGRLVGWLLVLALPATLDEVGQWMTRRSMPVVPGLPPASDGETPVASPTGPAAQEQRLDQSPLAMRLELLTSQREDGTISPDDYARLREEALERL